MDPAAHSSISSKWPQWRWFSISRSRFREHESFRIHIVWSRRRRDVRPKLRSNEHYCALPSRVRNARFSRFRTFFPLSLATRLFLFVLFTATSVMRQRSWLWTAVNGRNGRQQRASLSFVIRNLAVLLWRNFRANVFKYFSFYSF